MARVLAVDDSQTIRDMVAYTLESVGYEVTLAEDGDVALSIAKGAEFDLVLADVNMPNMDGISLVRELRGLDAFRFTPILMVTTETAPEKKQSAKQAGATGWITKPFDPEKLLDTIGRVLR